MTPARRRPTRSPCRWPSIVLLPLRACTTSSRLRTPGLNCELAPGPSALDTPGRMLCDGERRAAHDSAVAMRREVATFRVAVTSFCEPDGTSTGQLPAFANDIDTLSDLYRAMVLTRTFDAKAVALQRTGRLGTFALVARSGGRRRRDRQRRCSRTTCWSRRSASRVRCSCAASIPPSCCCTGAATSAAATSPVNRHDFPICVPIGTQAPHAIGVALAIQLRGQPRVRRVRIRRRCDIARRCLRGDELRRRPPAPRRVRRQQQSVGDLGAAVGPVGRRDAGPEGDRGRHSAANRSTATMSSRCGR